MLHLCCLLKLLKIMKMENKNYFLKNGARIDRLNDNPFQSIVNTMTIIAIKILPTWMTSVEKEQIELLDVIFRMCYFQQHLKFIFITVFYQNKYNQQLLPPKRGPIASPTKSTFTFLNSYLSRCKRASHIVGTRLTKLWIDRKHKLEQLADWSKGRMMKKQIRF